MRLLVGLLLGVVIAYPLGWMTLGLLTDDCPRCGWPEEDVER